MNINNHDLKPFYIYTDRNSLYIKNINEHTEKLSNNICSYGANIDDSQQIHICCIDLNGKLIHITNNKNHWCKKTVCKVFNSVKNIKNMRLLIINNYLNIFVVEQSPTNDSLYNVSHLNFVPTNYNVSKFRINNIFTDDESIYKLDVDDESNINFEYNSLNSSTRSCVDRHLVFDNVNRTWMTPNGLVRNNNNNKPDKIITKSSTSRDKNNTATTKKNNIKKDIFKYSSSINYKL